MISDSCIEQVNLDCWQNFLSLLPAGWEKDAAELCVMKGMRQDKSLLNTMRVLMIHIGTGASLRETALRGRIANLCNMTPAALYHRLIKLGPLFERLCQRIVDNNNSLQNNDEYRFCIVDGSEVREPGPTGSAYRIHYSFMLPHFRCNYLKVTPNRGKDVGESLKKYPVHSGDMYIADRGYCRTNGLFHVERNGGHFLVRYLPSSVPLFSDNKETRFPLENKLQTLQNTGDAKAWNCYIRNPESKEMLPVRLCVIRKDPDSIRRSQLRAREKSNKNNTKIQDKTLFFNEYIMVITTFPIQDFSLHKILEIYRWRWQIELVFKRFKSLLALGCLPKTTDESSKAWIHGKMLLALIIERTSICGCSFSPWRQTTKEQFQRELMEAF